MEEREAGRRGRPVSQRSRTAAVAAATSLLDESGWSGFSIDEVARRSAVSKATIYRHWTGGFALAVEAWGAVVDVLVPTLQTEDPGADLRDQMLRLARFYTTRRGRIAIELVAAGVSLDGGSALVDERFFGVRRRATLELLQHGVRSGRLRADLDAQLMIDLLFGPIVFRLINGKQPLTETEVGELARVVLPALETLH